jgi:hypothetical protein
MLFMIIEYVASAFLYSKELSERGLSQRLEEIYTLILSLARFQSTTCSTCPDGVC